MNERQTIALIAAVLLVSGSPGDWGVTDATEAALALWVEAGAKLRDHNRQQTSGALDKEPWK